jgi:hypothetical protein
MSEYKSTGEAKYTVYFIGDDTHCVLNERSLRGFSEYFHEFAVKAKRGVGLRDVIIT